MSHVLDRPVWNALTGPHARFSEGGAAARRYQCAIVPFAAAADASAQSLKALAELPGPGEEMLLVEAGEIFVPGGFVAVSRSSVTQLILKDAPAQMPDPRIVPLGDADAAEMLTLASLTKPGPFTLRAQALGTFFGIRIDGRIAAMAGVRMQQAGHTEVSGVCTHPDFQGHGLGRTLSIFMTHRVLASGDVPYLHAYSSNSAAIGLYRSIGYETRTSLNLALIRPDSA